MVSSEELVGYRIQRAYEVTGFRREEKGRRKAAAKDLSLKDELAYSLQHEASIILHSFPSCFAEMLCVFSLVIFLFAFIHILYLPIDKLFRGYGIKCIA